MTHLPDASQRVERLVDDHSDLVLRVCYARLGNLHDARDACQTVFLKCLQHLTAQQVVGDPASFETPEHERAWLIRCAVNTCIDLQRNGWHRKVDPLDSADEPRAATPPDPLELAESHAQVLSAVNELPPAMRQAVYLHYFEGYAVRDIARLTGEAPNTVSQHLSRARAKLRTLLEGAQQ